MVYQRQLNIMVAEKKRLKSLYKVTERLKLSYRTPDLQKLSLEQLEFINHQLKKPCYLKACPGSGKTEVVGIKAAFELASWQKEFSGIAILTFTRNAAAEIKNRVVKYAGINATKHPHFIGTFDSWMHNYILQPFAHKLLGYKGINNDASIRIIESDSKAGFLSNYQTMLDTGSKKVPIAVTDFRELG